MLPDCVCVRVDTSRWKLSPNAAASRPRILLCNHHHHPFSGVNKPAADEDQRLFLGVCLLAEAFACFGGSVFPGVKSSFAVCVVVFGI